VTTREHRPHRIPIPFGCGIALGGGLHTLLVTVAGLAPTSRDDLDLWSLWFIYFSAPPVFAITIVGLVLAPSRSDVGTIGKGLILGAIASPLLWLGGALLAYGG
jgi:hypothetical protein